MHGEIVCLLLSKGLRCGPKIGSAYLMEATTAKEIGRIPHIDIVNRVAFSTDGNMLATASSRVVQFWDIEKIQQIKKDALIEAACSRLTENFSEAEWSTRFEDKAYRPLCENLPVP